MSADGVTVQLRRWRTEESLERIHCVIQDQKGFLWLGTDDGLNRFDGYDFRVFRPERVDRSPVKFRVDCIDEDSQGRLWLSGNDGLTRFDPTTHEFVEYGSPHHRSDLQYTQLLAMKGEAKAVIWIGTNKNGLYRFDPTKKSFTRFPLRLDDTASRPLSVNSLLSTKSTPGLIWVGTESDGLICVDIDTKEIHRFVDDSRERHAVPPPMQVNSVVEDSTGSLWVASGDDGSGLYRFDVRTAQFAASFPFNAGKQATETARITSVVHDQNGRIWVAGDDRSIARFLPDERKFQPTRQQVPPQQSEKLHPDDTTFLYVDRTGLIWAAGPSAGLSSFDPQSDLVKLHRFEGAPGSERLVPIRCMCQDGQDEDIVWIGSKSCLIRWNHKAGDVKYYHNGDMSGSEFVHCTVTSLSPRSSGGLWIGTPKGLHVYDPASDRVAPQKAHQPPSWLTALYEDRGGRLWIGRVDPNAVELRDPAFDLITNYRHDPFNSDSILSGSVRSIREDRLSRLWFVHQHKGVVCLDASTGNITSVLEFKSESARMHSIRLDSSRNAVWLGTKHGLHRIPTYDRLHLLSPKDTQFPIKFSSSFINAIEEDDAGHLWLTTSNGLVRMSDRHSETPQFHLVTHAKGAFNGAPFAHLKLASGELLFGTNGGVFQVRPDRFQTRSPPSIAITDLQLDNGSIKESSDGASVLSDDITVVDQISLPHRQNGTVTFEFSALDFHNPDLNQYSYRLLGHDHEWRDGSARIATYSGLRPGHYLFRVKAANSQGVWNEEGASLELTVLPPWWKAWWFGSGVAVVLVGCAVALTHFRFRRIRARNRTLSREVRSRKEAEQRYQQLASQLIHSQERERRHIAGELHDDLTQRLATMAMGAAALKRDIKVDPQQASESLAEIENELGELSAATQELSRRLHPKIIEDLGINDAVRAECRRFTKRTGLEIEVNADSCNSELTRDEELCIYRVLQESLNNVVKHASASCAKVTLNNEGRATKLTVVDDGVGFDVDKPLQNGTLGLTGMVERARFCDGSLTVHSTPNEGTAVELSLTKGGDGR